MTKRELSEAIWAFEQEHGMDELYGVLARSMITLGFKCGAGEMEFTDEHGLGTVSVQCTAVPDEQKN